MINKIKVLPRSWAADVWYFTFIWIIISFFCRKLQSEYDRLKKAHDRKGLSPLPSPPEMLPVSPQSARDAELIAEAKLLRQHKGRLEARMQILEDHNKQLESQLHRLRQLLEQVHTHLHMQSILTPNTINICCLSHPNEPNCLSSVFFSTQHRAQWYVMVLTCIMLNPEADEGGHEPEATLFVGPLVTAY